MGDLNIFQSHIRDHFQDKLDYCLGFSAVSQLNYLRLWNKAPTHDLAYLPSFYVIVVAASDTQFKLSLVTFAGQVLEEAIANLSENKIEHLPFPGFFWSICRDEFNLCSGIKPPEKSSTELLIEHCDQSEKFFYRSKRCTFRSNSPANGNCSVCENFQSSTENEQNVSKTELKDIDLYEQIGDDASNKEISSLKSRKSLQLPISISIFPKIAGRPKSGKKLGTTLGRAIKKEVGNDNYALFLDQPKRIKRTSQFSASNVEDVNEINDYDDQDDVDHEPDNSDFGQDINSGDQWIKQELDFNIEEDEDRPLKVRKKRSAKNCRTGKIIDGVRPVAKSKKVKERIKVKRDCKSCKKKFPDLIRLWDHFKNPDCKPGFEKWKNEARFIQQCTICLSVYDSEIIFNRDKANHEEILTGLDDPVTCPICFKSIESRRVINQHYATEHATDDEKCMCCICLIVIGRYRIKTHFIQNHSAKDRGFLCPICGKKCRQKNLLRLHLAAAHEVAEDGISPAAKIVCELCGKAYKNYLLLHSHKAKKHKAKTMYHCDECNKDLMFHYKAEFMSHKVAVHLQIKPFGCHLCNHFTSTLSSMYKHYKFIHKVAAKRTDFLLDQEKMDKIREILDYDYRACITEERKQSKQETA